MKMPTVFHLALGAGALAILLGGCNSGAGRLGLTGAPAPDRLNHRAGFRPHRLWAVPDIARISRLLFLTDWGSKTVTVYSMPTMKVVGQVGGFQYPVGACNDRSGNIWIADYDGQTLTRFNRALDATGELDDTHGTPFVCSVDPTTGNLAVANQQIDDGNVVIYKDARGSGRAISNPEQAEYFYLGYDRSGNLWVDGYDQSRETFMLSSCSFSSCRTVPISGGTIYTPGFVQWAVGLHSWYVADRDCGNTLAFCIYPVSPSGVLGKPIAFADAQGRTVCSSEDGAISNAESGVLVGSVRAVVIGSTCQYIATIADRWNFPTGGTATNEVGGSEDAFGVAISRACCVVRGPARKAR